MADWLQDAAEQYAADWRDWLIEHSDLSQRDLDVWLQGYVRGLVNGFRLQQFIAPEMTDAALHALIEAETGEPH
ncbi:hypothetical protein [Kribbella sp. NPDC004536]|uniref:hypothetical protein n=1 Tax=Kribbella sp. NPDC004536 TaxID=3364106 RepID=UPI003686241D